MEGRKNNKLKEEKKDLKGEFCAAGALERDRREEEPVLRREQHGGAWDSACHLPCCYKCLKKAVQFYKYDESLTACMVHEYLRVIGDAVRRGSERQDAERCPPRRPRRRHQRRRRQQAQERAGHQQRSRGDGAPHLRTYTDRLSLLAIQPPAYGTYTYTVISRTERSMKIEKLKEHLLCAGARGLGLGKLNGRRHTLTSFFHLRKPWRAPSLANGSHV